MGNLKDVVSRAMTVGNYAADLELVDKDRGEKDNIHHLGDDTGDLITEAYRQHGGAVAGADVIDAYLDAFNARRQKDGVRKVTPAEAIAHLSWAIKPNGITRSEQEQVAAEFKRRHL